MLRIIVVFKEENAKLSIIINSGMQQCFANGADFYFCFIDFICLYQCGKCAELFIVNYFSAFGQIIDSEHHKLHFALSLPVLALMHTLLSKCNILILWRYESSIKKEAPAGVKENKEE